MQLSKRSTLLRRTGAKEKVNRVNEPKILPREASGRAHRRKWREIASRGRSFLEAGRSIAKPKGEGKCIGKSGGKAKGKGKGLKCYVCREIGHTARLHPSEGWVSDLEQDTPEREKTPKKTSVGPKSTTRHSSWDTLAASFV